MIDSPAADHDTTEGSGEDAGIDLNELEADLEEILNERLVAGDDVDDEDDELFQQNESDSSKTSPAGPGEWRCQQCFLIVSKSHFGSLRFAVCPSGEDPCESIGYLR